MPGAVEGREKVPGGSTRWRWWWLIQARKSGHYSTVARSVIHAELLLLWLAAQLVVLRHGGD